MQSVNAEMQEAAKRAGELLSRPSKALGDALAVEQEWIVQPQAAHRK